MYRSQYLFLIVAMSIGLAQSWDVAVTMGDQLEFYSNQTLINREGVQFRDLTALAYDAVHNMLLFVDKQSDNASIFSYHFGTKKYQSLVRRRSSENIQGVAFDPVRGLLFWTDTIEKSIFFMSLMPGSNNSLYGDLFIRMHNEIPRGIAVDSCNGYVYWTNTNISKPTIERARFDGTERTVIVGTNIFMPVSLVIDQQTKRLYWADDKEGIDYTIESSDLDGHDRNTLVSGQYHKPNSLTVSKDSIFWVDLAYKTVWSIPKNSKMDTEPKEYIEFNNGPFGVVANYRIEDQIDDTSACDKLLHLSENSTAINDTFNVPADIGLFCVHGTIVIGKLECKCTVGYTGDRCDVSVCKDYCYRGQCTFTAEGKPMCSCDRGYTGSRCETEICYNYCLNTGNCEVNEKHEPFCSCSRDFEGLRCENVKPITTIQPPAPVTTVTPVKETEGSLIEKPAACNCTKEEDTTKITLPFDSANDVNKEYFIEEGLCNDGWDTFNHPVFMVLAITCGLLSVACVVLITKVMQLKKRPRIKKRIIVNKNVTPLTARPDQCEITIENCCNMNICETPCFEPRSTIRPTLINLKPGKEEKKNLISNMECPDDY